MCPKSHIQLTNGHPTSRVSNLGLSDPQTLTLSSLKYPHPPLTATLSGLGPRSLPSAQNGLPCLTPAQSSRSSADIISPVPTTLGKICNHSTWGFFLVLFCLFFCCQSSTYSHSIVIICMYFSPGEVKKTLRAKIVSYILLSSQHMLHGLARRLRLQVNWWQT